MLARKNVKFGEGENSRIRSVGSGISRGVFGFFCKVFEVSLFSFDAFFSVFQFFTMTFSCSSSFDSFNFFFSPR